MPFLKQINVIKIYHFPINPKEEAIISPFADSFYFKNLEKDQVKNQQKDLSKYLLF